MAVNNINPSGPGGPIKRDQEAGKIKTDAAAKSPDTQETPVKAPETARTEQIQTDTVQLSVDRKYVEELVDTVERMNDAPREDLVKRVAERVRNGEYSGTKFMENLALKIINTEA